MAMMHNPPHPGRILARYVKAHGVTTVAEYLGVTRPALSRVVNGRAAISPEMAMRLSKTFPNTDAETWLKMQVAYDLWQIRKKKISAKPIPAAA